MLEYVEATTGRPCRFRGRGTDRRADGRSGCMVIGTPEDLVVVIGAAGDERRGRVVLFRRHERAPFEAVKRSDELIRATSCRSSRHARGLSRRTRSCGRRRSSARAALDADREGEGGASARRRGACEPGLRRRAGASEQVVADDELVTVVVARQSLGRQEEVAASGELDGPQRADLLGEHGRAASRFPSRLSSHARAVRACGSRDPPLVDYPSPSATAAAGRRRAWSRR